MSSADPIARLDRIGAWPNSRRVLIVIGAAYLFAFFDIVNIGAALPKIAEQLGISSGRASLAVSVSLAGCLIGALADGWVSDRIGRRVVRRTFLAQPEIVCPVTPATAPVRDRAVPPYDGWGRRRPRHPAATHRRPGSRPA